MKYLLLLYMMGAGQLFALDSLLHVGGENSPVFGVDEAVEVYQETDGPKALQEVINAPFSSQFDPSIYRSEKAIWMRFRIVNQGNGDRFILTADQWQEIQLYVISDDGIQSIHSGTGVLPADRPESVHRLLFLPFELEEKDTATLYLRARNTDPFIQYYAQIYDFARKNEIGRASSVRSRFTNNQMLVIFVIGICFVLFIYNLVITLTRFRIEHLLLTLYIFITSIFLANIHGISTNYFFPDFTSFELELGFILSILNSLLLIYYLFFSLKFNLRTVQALPVILFSAFLLFTLIYSEWKNESFWYTPRRYLEFLVISILLIYALVKRKGGAVFISAAVLVSIGGKYLSEYYSTQTLGTFLAGDFPYLIGMLIQMGLFTINSSYQIRRLELRLLASIKEQQELLENQNEILNKRVTERTQLIEEQNKDLLNRQEEILAQSEKISRINKKLRKKTDELNELNQQLEKLVEERTDGIRGKNERIINFMWYISHKIRGPISRIIGLIYLYDNNMLNEEESQQFYDLINHEVRNLDELVHEFSVMMDQESST